MFWFIIYPSLSEIVIFTKDVTIPANTTKNSPVSQTLPVAAGLVYRVNFRFPQNLLGLAGIAVYDGSFQLWPSSPNEWFHSNNETITFNDLYLKKSEPMIFVLKGYNTDDTYGHTIQVRIGLVSEEKFQARYMPHLAVKEFEEMMKRIADEQEQTNQEILDNALVFWKEAD